MELPNFGLALAYWLHIIATVIWIGGIMSLSLLVLPAARRTLKATDYAAFIGRLQEGLQRIGWLSLAVLTGTGMFQMSAHPEYEGFLAVNNSWAAAILTKHIAIGGMVIVSAYITWGLLPALKRIALKRAAGLEIDEGQQAQLLKRESLGSTINLVLSVVILLLTAIARAS